MFSLQRFALHTLQYLLADHPTYQQPADQEMGERASAGKDLASFPVSTASCFLKLFVVVAHSNVQKQ